MEPQLDDVCGPQCRVCGLGSLPTRDTRAMHVVARSPAMQRLLQRAARFAASDAPVAIVGETGTGKEVVARILHLNSSRTEGPFVAVNVAALPAELLESELFGHGKGAFTGATSARRGLFEAAHGGTLFLDEIGEMPPSLQAKLLRALQDGEIRRLGENRAFAVDVRVLCATHRDLHARVEEGAFREDLYYRLKVLTLAVPPLRERVEDILPLARRFLGDEGRAAKRFAPAAARRLERYPWPGNVRELQNAVKHGAALATSVEVKLVDLPDELQGRVPLSRLPLGHQLPPVGVARPRSASQFQTLAEVEQAHIARVLEACHGGPSEAARLLGIARNTLWRKLRRPAPASTAVRRSDHDKRRAR